MTTTMPYCGACGYDSTENVNDDVLCDSCGEDLTLHGFVKPEPPAAPAADEPLVKPKASSTKTELVNWLFFNTGEAIGDLSELGKAELWDKINEALGGTA